MDYMGCQQQRTTNIDVLKVASSMSEHCKDLKLNYLYLVSLSFKYTLLDKSELEEGVNEENCLSDVPKLVIALKITK